MQTLPFLALIAIVSFSPFVPAVALLWSSSLFEFVDNDLVLLRPTAATGASEQHNGTKE